MPASSFSASIDRDAEKRMLAGYTPQAVQKILKEAAKEGGKEGAKVMRASAPIGTSSRPSQYYRRNGLPHGTFKRAVKWAAIRRFSTDTVGVVIGPMGSKAFTRGWIEAATGWVASVAGSALSTSQRASERVLDAYVRRT